MIPTRHPEVQTLRERCSQLRHALRESIDEYVRLTTEEHHRLMQLYDVNFGALEHTRQQLTLACAELFRRIELLSIKVARGETITPEIVMLVNKVVDKEYERMYQRLRDASRIDRERREQQAGDYGNASESRQAVGERDELTRMYRTLAKRLHPDAFADESAERRKDWDAVQDAYSRRNVSRLRSMVAALGDEIALPKEDLDSIERLRSDVAILETRLRIEKRRLTRLQSQEPFSIARELMSEAWRERHKAELEGAVQAKHAELERHKAQYKELAHAEVPMHTPVPGSDKDFDTDFMDNTYFGSR